MDPQPVKIYRKCDCHPYINLVWIFVSLFAQNPFYLAYQRMFIQLYACTLWHVSAMQTRRSVLAVQQHVCMLNVLMLSHALCIFVYVSSKNILWRVAKRTRHLYMCVFISSFLSVTWERNERRNHLEMRRKHTAYIFVCIHKKMRTHCT